MSEQVLLGSLNIHTHVCVWFHQEEQALFNIKLLIMLWLHSIMNMLTC